MGRHENLFSVPVFKKKKKKKKLKKNPKIFTKDNGFDFYLVLSILC